jgi:hypothetical protein
MIVMEQKPLEEILNSLGRAESVLVVGCDGCAGIYQVGGQKQAETMRTLLEMGKKLKENRDVKVKPVTLLRQCDLHVVSTSLRPIIDDYERVLSLACGVGVQTIVQAFPNKAIMPANNTKFIGMQDRELGNLYEYCRACGDCVLFETGGICPVARCAKGIKNGPCGGQAKGKCEVGNYTRDCAWVLIWKSLKEKGMLDSFAKFRAPEDRSAKAQPGEIKSEVEG